jgi:hypothetical protein
MKADKLASFRVDSQLWEQFQAVAKENNNTASALLVAYIKQVVNPNNVNTSSEVVNTSSDHLSIRDIDSRIDEKISQSIQDINTPSIQNIEDLIDSRIDGLIEEFQLIKKQLEELTVIPPDAAVPLTNDELPDPDKNQIQNIRTTLNRKNIRVRSSEIRKAFYDAGWVGNNFQEIRKDILEILGGDK